MLKASRNRSFPVKSIPAPVGGWNARDSWADMPETDAVSMVNMFPTTTDVSLRKGRSDHVTGITGTVETLAAYSSPSANKLFAVAGTAIYNVSSAGAVGAAVQSGLSNARWQYENFSVPTGAAWMYMVNGTDKPRAYDGTNWTAVDAASTPAITGVTTTDLIQVNVFQRRLWFVQKASTKAWYLPTDSVAGVAQSIDLGPLFSSGGYLVAMGTWTIDAGSGMDDHAVFISSVGEIAVYKGTDPASASTWSLVGVFSAGAPIGRRCFMKFGGDLLLITKDGVVPMSKALLSARLNNTAAITNKIQSAMSDAAMNYGSNFGWQLQQYPVGNMLILNVPTSATVFQQYVMNTISGAWCSFEGWNASCWELFNDSLYFGGNGVVCKAWDTYADSGALIVGDTIPAFSYFGSPQLKRWTMARPVIAATGTPSISLAMNTDFTTTAYLGTPSFSASDGAVWDSATWDTSIWGGGLSIFRDWQSVSGYGQAGSLHLKIASKYYNVRWQATDYVFEKGGVL
jgi:hypothetical protein